MKDLEQLKKDALGFPERAKMIIVHNAGTLTLANEFLQSIKSLMKEIAETFNPIIKKAHEAHKEAVAKKKEHEAPLMLAETTIKLHIGSYLEVQARIRRQAEEEARKAEEERQKEEDRILAEAKILEDSGKEKEAQSLQAEIPLPARVDIPPEPEAKGLSLKQILDTDQINMIVKRLGGETRIPGIRVYPEWKWAIDDRKLIPKSYYKSTVASRTETMTQGKPEDA
ncbi:MAG: hypothetical protein KAV87_54190 [Desulfobacteraceae bacterium]|nr:hypothetical protein [Desulfobacteraceae bacterium]